VARLLLVKRQEIATMPKKILVAHDFSAPADRALAFALDMARQIGASLEVVHVCPEQYEVGTLGDVMWPAAGEELHHLRALQTELQRRVHDVVAPEARELVHQRVARGAPVEQLQKLAAQVGADLICVGATGKGAVQRALLGSVSQQLLRTSTIPVMTVH
jgi:nucleotide-binding universal stress UspA family protein